MLNIGLQFFAHKKGVGSTRNGRESESKRLQRYARDAKPRGKALSKYA